MMIHIKRPRKRHNPSDNNTGGTPGRPSGPLAALVPGQRQPELMGYAFDQYGQSGQGGLGAVVVGQVGQPHVPAGPVEDRGDGGGAGGADDQVAFEMSDLDPFVGDRRPGSDRVELAERRFRL